MSSRSPTSGVVVSLVGIVSVLAGCSLPRERMCSGGEYPVYALEAPSTGRTCVDDGDEPPSGYAPYPEGRVPEYLDEDYNPANPEEWPPRRD